MLRIRILFLGLAVVGSAMAAANAPSLRSYAYSITDFQGHHVDLTDGKPDLFTPVQSFTAAPTKNQEWVVISSMDARQVYELLNVASNSIMSHTTALLKTPGPAIHAQIVGSNQTAFWRLNGTTDGQGTRLSDPATGLVLTAWPASSGSPSSPLTLEELDPRNARQVFKLKCLYSWSFPGPC